MTTPLQSLTTLRGLHSSKARTTARSSAQKPTAGSQTDLEHIVHHCPHWHTGRRDSGLWLSKLPPVCAFMGFCRSSCLCLCRRVNLPLCCVRVWTRPGLM
eukprot:3836719-Amphidinium_carterae.1